MDSNKDGNKDGQGKVVRYNTRYQKELAIVKELEAELDRLQWEIEVTNSKNDDLKAWHRKWDEAVREFGLDPNLLGNWSSGEQEGGQQGQQGQ